MYESRDAVVALLQQATGMPCGMNKGRKGHHMPHCQHALGQYHEQPITGWVQRVISRDTDVGGLRHDRYLSTRASPAHELVNSRTHDTPLPPGRGRDMRC